MRERKDIGLRLENWARWATSSVGARAADSMTGAICESLRKAALGNVWSGHEVREETDSVDAMAIERGMRYLIPEWRLLLWWCYIKQQAPEFICRKMGYPVRPGSVFVEKFRTAQAEIEDIVDGGNF